jgi:hypothetical protein
MFVAVGTHRSTALSAGKHFELYGKPHSHSADGSQNIDQLCVSVWGLLSGSHFVSPPVKNSLVCAFHCVMDMTERF